MLDYVQNIPHTQSNNNKIMNTDFHKKFYLH